MERLLDLAESAEKLAEKLWFTWRVLHGVESRLNTAYSRESFLDMRIGGCRVFVHEYILASAGGLQCLYPIFWLSHLSGLLGLDAGRLRAIAERATRSFSPLNPEQVKLTAQLKLHGEVGREPFDRHFEGFLLSAEADVVGGGKILYYILRLARRRTWNVSLECLVDQLSKQPGGRPKLTHLAEHEEHVDPQVKLDKLAEHLDDLMGEKLKEHGVASLCTSVYKVMLLDHLPEFLQHSHALYAKKELVVAILYP